MSAAMEEQSVRGGQSTDGGLEQRARALLIGSAENLPGAVRSRLTQARHAALAARHARMRYRLQRWLPAGAVAAAALALLVVFVPHGQHAPASAVMPLNADQDVDDDFYEWAVAAANGAGAVHMTATNASGT